MLRNIPQIISPELMYTLMEMGYSDQIILADANFPAKTYAKKLIRCDGTEILDLLEAILKFMPLDSFVQYPVKLMEHLDTDPTPEIWKKYDTLIRKYDKEKTFDGFERIERLDFYEKARNATAIVTTCTTARYANIVLQKGVL